MEGYCSEQQAVKAAAAKLGYQMIPVNRFLDPRSGSAYTAKEVAKKYVYKSGILYYLQGC